MSSRSTLPSLVACALSALGVPLAGCGAASESTCLTCDVTPGAPVMGRLSGDVALAVGPSELVWFAGYDADFGALVVGRVATDAGDANVLVEPVRVDDGAPASRRVGERVSLAVGADGEPRVAYLDAAGGQAFVARRRGAWEVEAVDGPGVRPVFEAPSSSAEALPADDDGVAPFVTQVALAVDAGGGEHVVTLDAVTGSLRIISSTGACREVGGAIAPVGTPLGEIVPRIVDASALDAAGVGRSRVGGVPSIAVDATGAIAVSLYLEATGDLALLTCAGESLAVRTIAGTDGERDLGDVGYWSSVAVDPRSGKLAIAFFDRTRGQLAYATSVKGEKAIVVIDDGSSELGAFSRYVGQMPSLAFAPLGSIRAGRPAVAYLDASEAALRLAVLDDFGRWGHAAVAEAGPLQGRPAAAAVASGTWVAFARDGQVHAIRGNRDDD